MTTLNGSCHCGSVRVAFMPSLSPEDLAVRACQCGFCRRHGARTVSDPNGSVHLTAAPGAYRRYRFGRRAVDALLCRECGIYLGSFIEVETGLIGTINVAGVDLEGLAGRAAESISYDDETDEERLARRKARWTPAILVQASPSA